MRRIVSLVAVLLAATVLPAIVSPQGAAAARPNAAVQVADIDAGLNGSGPNNLTRFGDIALFQAFDQAHGYELWQTDGTAAGTSLVKDINPGAASSDPNSFTVFGDIVLFVANDTAAGIELWKTDGTAAGTTRIKDINPGIDDALGVGSPELTVFGPMVLFKAYNPTEGSELWRTDGTAAGTTLIDLAPGTNSVGPFDLTVFGGVVLFTGDASVVPGSGSSSQAIFKTDGTVTGTSVVTDLTYGGDAGPQITPFGSIALFVAANGATGTELWKTDGTPAGTALVKDISASDSDPHELTPFGNIVLFTATTSGAGDELWKTDGTEAGTVQVKDIYPVANSGSAPHGYTVFGSKVLFVASDEDGAEIWKTDGTETGTSQVQDICPGSFGSSPTELTVFGSVVAFNADDCVHGNELWASNGTAAGTSLVTDLFPGGSSYPVSLLDFGTMLLFSADDGVDGQELFRTVFRRVPGAPTIGTATAGNTQATVSFTPPASTGGSPITSYTVTSTPGGITKTGAGSPITVTGLTNGVSYRFSVHATNANGPGAESALSNAVTPTAPTSKSITVVQPNGGEHLARGVAYTIKWTYTGSPGTTVKILLLKAGTTVQTIASSQAIGSSGAGQRSWTPPTTLAVASTYKIRILVNASSPVIADLSNNTFSLT
ncbi:MAG: hypothetical protein QOI61_1492 [Actinomycetota bacterium]|jgi:ELWxxDGT repeat protein